MLQGLGLSFNIKEVDEFKTGVSALRTAYHRVDVLSDITWKLRKLQTLATGIYKLPATENKTIHEIAMKAEVFLRANKKD